MVRALVIAEHDGTYLAGGSAGTLGAALALGAEAVDIAVVGQNTASVAAEAARLTGVDRVLELDRDEHAPYLAVVWAPRVAEIAAGYTHLFAPASTFGKDLLPRVAALLGVSALSDITAVEGPYEFARPIYAGNAIARIRADSSRVVCATVRPAAFEAPAATGAARIEKLELTSAAPAHTRFIERRGNARSGPALETAARVVAGGRGLAGPDAFALLERLAAALGAAVGASRAAVDAGWAPNDLQIGQTGKIIAPELYIAIGISGAIQHLTGIKDAGTIVAINSDASAPICGMADIVLNADLFAALPRLIEELEARPGS